MAAKRNVASNGRENKSLFAHVTNTARACFSLLILRWKSLSMGRFGVSLPVPEASPELVLSIPMCNECEFFCVDSDEEVRDGLESGVSTWQDGYF